MGIGQGFCPSCGGGTPSSVSIPGGNSGNHPSDGDVGSCPPFRVSCSDGIFWCFPTFPSGDSSSIECLCQQCYPIPDNNPTPDNQSAFLGSTIDLSQRQESSSCGCFGFIKSLLCCGASESGDDMSIGGGSHDDAVRFLLCDYHWEPGDFESSDSASEPLVLVDLQPVEWEQEVSTRRVGVVDRLRNGFSDRFTPELRSRLQSLREVFLILGLLILLLIFLMLLAHFVGDE
ncbi:hypothetical protein [Candidatus Ichthyocystis hellenicum]|uniref:hypothetical protein n=1 Tax=Candidatus Ichthyocystis hellenicum TaxID=1561003 RepID=UPI000B87E6E8|nr:hypothetical protein [Candidatus Ichthyocystis hellenicum]